MLYGKTFSAGIKFPLGLKCRLLTKGEKKKISKDKLSLFSCHSFISIGLIHFFSQVVFPVLHLPLGSLLLVSFQVPLTASGASPPSKQSQSHCTWVAVPHPMHIPACRMGMGCSRISAGELGLHWVLSLHHVMAAQLNQGYLQSDQWWTSRQVKRRKQFVLHISAFKSQVMYKYEYICLRTCKKTWKLCEFSCEIVHRRPCVCHCSWS